MKKILPAFVIVFVFVLVIVPLPLAAQTRVLFIGNSYTEVGNLPQMTAQVSRSLGFEMTYSSNTPGGCTFSQHCTNQSINLIRQDNWDIVVLQEQSQLPSFPQNQVENEVFPYAAQLVSAVYTANPCAEPMFYMTWGRRDGDPQNAPYFPVLATYQGMDSMLCERYTYMASAYDASLCPVGRVWRNLRENHPEIELYQSDGSHPSTAGTYAAACAFAVMFFAGQQADPLNITYSPQELPDETAQTIRQAVHQVVFSQIDRWQRPEPQADILSTDILGTYATFTLHTEHADTLLLDFGDGTQLSILNTHLPNLTDTLVTHTYPDTGTYQATLIAIRHCLTDTARTTLHLTLPDTTAIPQFLIPNSKFLIHPNPTTGHITVTLKQSSIQALKQSPLTLTLCDLTGCQLFKQQITASQLSTLNYQLSTDLPPLPSGTYLLTLSTPTASSSHRLLIK